jgi:hypothetical protein
VLTIVAGLEQFQSAIIMKTKILVASIVKPTTNELQFFSSEQLGLVHMPVTAGYSQQHRFGQPQRGSMVV